MESLIFCMHENGFGFSAVGKQHILAAAPS